jgi:hypothetical protein
MAQFPKSQTDDVILAIGAKNLAKKTETSNSDCQIAPWHFDPQRCCCDKTQGTWKLKKCPKAKRFRDSDGKHWFGNPPSNHSPKKFKDKELDGKRMLPKDRW